MLRIGFKNIRLFTNNAIWDPRLSLENKNLVRYLDNLKQEFYTLKTSSGLKANDHFRIKELSDVVDTYEKRNCVVENILSLSDLNSETDEDIKSLILEEKETYLNILKKLEDNLIRELLMLPKEEECSSVIFEINPGVGGQEAMLFADELFGMYSNFISNQGWTLEVIEKDHNEIGGLRHANCIVYGKQVYELLQNEAGVHRVQRVPTTEKSGRTHTSTATVSVFPRPHDIKVLVEAKSLKIETKRASGAGGQHVNTTDSAVRIVHIPTGTTVECQSERSQIKNKEIAIKKLENILLKKEYENQLSSKLSSKKAQVGTSNRNEKIRTYNFTQDRITDHRLKHGTLHNLREFLNGSQTFNQLLQQLLLNERKKKLLLLIENMV